MYATSENPVFDPWTPESGGGPPCLWEFEGHLYANRWLEANVVSLKELLTPESVKKALQRSVERLANEPEHRAARGIQEDWPLCEEALISRCKELPRVLATVSEAGRLFEWTV